MPGESAVQGTIYAAYFLGAFATTLLGGILSDRYGRVPLVRLGLGITVTSGLLLSVPDNTNPCHCRPPSRRNRRGIIRGIFLVLREFTPGPRADERLVHGTPQRRAC